MVWREQHQRPEQNQVAAQRAGQAPAPIPDQRRQVDQRGGRAPLPPRQPGDRKGRGGC